MDPYYKHASPAASHVSLPGILAPGASVTGGRLLKPDRSNLYASPSQGSGSVNPINPQRLARSQPSEVSRSADRTDALWAEMQVTLEEVELSASGGTHVFGLEHDRKLADLRTAQIALAQAWARGEADDAIDVTARDTLKASVVPEEVRNLKGGMTDAAKPSLGDTTDASRNAASANSARADHTIGGAERLGAKLEEETEVDILLARKRREANDEYFRRVNHGVLDVVAKLEDVAVAMRTVEQESRDVWSESDHVPTSAV